MKRILAASLVSCLALAGRAGASNRCDLDGLPGADVLVRYPIPHPEDVQRHTNAHIPWGIAAGPVGFPGEPINTNDPRVIGIGDFIATKGCDLLWEEAEPGSDDEVAIRVVVTEGLTTPSHLAFESGVARPPRPWDIAGVHDLTGDGRADVLWWHPGTGEMLLWVRDGQGWTEAAVAGLLPQPPAGPEATRPVTAIVRFEPQGPPGIVWHASGGDSSFRYFRALWSGSYLKIHDGGTLPGLSGPGLNLAAVGDFDDDLKDDLLLQRNHDEHLLVCYMDGLTLRECAPLSPPTFELPNYVLHWFVAGPR